MEGASNDERWESKADDKDVELDFTTYTPEVKLQLGKIVSAASGLKVKKLRRPVPVYQAEDADDEGYEEWDQIEMEQDGREEDEVVEIEWEALQREEGKWKVVPNIIALALSV